MWRLFLLFLAYEQKILKAIPLLSDEAHDEAEEEIQRLSSMKNDYFAKLLDDVRFTGPNNVEYRGLILEYLMGGDLGEFLANLQKNGKAVCFAFEVNFEC